MASLAAATVGGDRGDILNTTDLHASTSKSAQSGDAARTRGFGTVATGGTDLDVKRSHTKLLAAGSDVLSGKHRSVRRRLVPVSLHLHAAGDTDKSLLTG